MSVHPGRIEADELRLGDTDLRGLSERGFRRLRGQRIAMVLQDPKYSLDPVMSVGQQIAETHRSHLRSTKRDARRAALEMLQAVHIRDPERVYTMYPHQVSGGMGQRVMIAMMLIAGPDILIADEPTSALDVTVQTQVLAILDELVRSRGMGLILISHNLHLVSSFCDRVLVMYAGQVLETCAAGKLSEAQHPYTRGLLAALPQLGNRRGRAAAIAARPGLDGRPRMITLDGVTITYGSGPRAVVAVRDLTLAVAEGEAVGLVGESGSGKSTVLRAVAGLIPYAAGEITLAGRRVDRSRTTAQRKMTQMVFQDPYGSLHPNQTVDQILAMPVAIHRLDRGEARIAQALAEVGLGREHRYRYPHQLSGGQRQRVAIARALILEPRILLLDEPTSALDVSVQAEILNLLGRLRRDHGLTLLMVSHDLAVIAHLCERIGVMSRGQLLEITTATAMANNQVTHDYTRQLLRSNAGFDRSSAASGELDVVAG